MRDAWAGLGWAGGGRGGSAGSPPLSVILAAEIALAAQHPRPLVPQHLTYAAPVAALRHSQHAASPGLPDAVPVAICGPAAAQRWRRQSAGLRPPSRPRLPAGPRLLGERPSAESVIKRTGHQHNRKRATIPEVRRFAARLKRHIVNRNACIACSKMHDSIAVGCIIILF